LQHHQAGKHAIRQKNTVSAAKLPTSALASNSLHHDQAGPPKDIRRSTPKARIRD
jgi:hypothetical protein